ncbi:MAG: acyl-CoA dehydrogenase family protein, partial [Bacteroidota bacterium]
MVQAIIEQKKMEQRIQALDQLAQSKIAPRAAQYDQSTVFPRENFDDLFEGGFLGPTIGKAYGGMGLGHHNGDIHSLWRMTKAIARADMATARCWEGHANALLLINNIATEEQKKRWFEGVLQRGELWSAWSGEPLYRAPHEKAKYGTRMQKVEGG